METFDELCSEIELYEESCSFDIEGISISKSLEDRKSVKLYFKKVLGNIGLNDLKIIMSDTAFLVMLVKDSLKSIYGSVTPPHDFVDNLCTGLGITKYQLNSISDEGIPGDIDNIKLKELASILLRLEEEKILKDLGIK